jgi:hypothetical protein
VPGDGDCDGLDARVRPQDLLWVEPAQELSSSPEISVRHVGKELRDLRVAAKEPAVTR